MSSVRRLKQKNKATTGLPWWADSAFGGHGSEYGYRRAHFASLPPARVLRPLARLRKKADQYLSALHRALQAATTAGLDFKATHQATATQHDAYQGKYRIYQAARLAANRGEGHKVRQYAAQHA